MRQSWDEYFMAIAYLVAQRSTCCRRKVGAVAVSPENRILGTGYNGALPGALHCDEIGCLRDKLGIPSGQRQEICRAQHAEANVCNFAARYGVALEGATMYVTAQPCTICTKAMVTCGIKKVIFDSDYPDELACELAEETGMSLIRFSDLVIKKDDKKKDDKKEDD
ncbi:MAG: deoxycytidylate deaminase [Bacillota bacterium]|jgi:dCMP deaminase